MLPVLGFALRFNAAAFKMSNSLAWLPLCLSFSVVMEMAMMMMMMMMMAVSLFLPPHVESTLQPKPCTLCSVFFLPLSPFQPFGFLLDVLLCT